MTKDDQRKPIKLPADFKTPKEIVESQGMKLLKKLTDHVIKIAKTLGNQYHRQVDQRVKYMEDVEHTLQSLPNLKQRAAFLHGKIAAILKLRMTAKARNNFGAVKHYKRLLELLEGHLNVLPIEEAASLYVDGLMFQGQPPSMAIDAYESRSDNHPAPSMAISIKSSPMDRDQETSMPASTLPKGYFQIRCKGTKEEIMEYFMALNRKKNPRNNEPYMSAAYVTAFVHNIFAMFGKKPTGRKFEINLIKTEKRQLRYFMYGFYNKYEQKAQAKRKYAQHLIWGFKLFENDDLKHTADEMAPSRIPAKTEEIIQG